RALRLLHSFPTDALPIYRRKFNEFAAKPDSVWYSQSRLHPDCCMEGGSIGPATALPDGHGGSGTEPDGGWCLLIHGKHPGVIAPDRKSTRLNSSHVKISY